MADKRPLTFFGQTGSMASAFSQIIGFLGPISKSMLHYFNYFFPYLSFPIVQDEKENRHPVDSIDYHRMEKKRDRERNTDREGSHP